MRLMKKSLGVVFTVIVTPDSTAGTSCGLGWHIVCYISCIMECQKGHWWVGHQWVGHSREESYQSVS